MPLGLFGGLFDRPKRAATAPTRRLFARPVATPQPITTGRKIGDKRANDLWYQRKGTFGTSEGAEQVLPRGSAYEEAFLNGTLNYVTSSVIQSGKYSRAFEELTLTFMPDTGLVTTTYSGISEEEAVDFFVAGSKGKWWHQVCLGPDWRPGGLTAKPWRFA